jgi:dihydroorotase
MQKYLIRNINLVNEGKIEACDVFIANERIEKIALQINQPTADYTEINGEGKYLLPGVIDDQGAFPRTRTNV